MIKTEGVEFKELVAFSDKLDLTKIYSNDLHAICNTYGIEAASQAIRREVKNVFAVYGIQVDARHLSLIADFMTSSGRILGMNRQSFRSHSSPLQQMTFETTAGFLERSAFYGFLDHVDSPSARIVAGLPTKGGTGAFDLISKVVEVQHRPKRSFRKSMTANLSMTSEVTPGKTDIKRKSAIILPMTGKKIRFE
jgi:DNA-directed RNA polymerase I subunit RPA1